LLLACLFTCWRMKSDCNGPGEEVRGVPGAFGGIAFLKSGIVDDETASELYIYALVRFAIILGNGVKSPHGTRGEYRNDPGRADSPPKRFVGGDWWRGR